MAILKGGLFPTEKGRRLRKERKKMAEVPNFIGWGKIPRKSLPWGKNDGDTKGLGLSLKSSKNDGSLPFIVKTQRGG